MLIFLSRTLSLSLNPINISQRSFLYKRSIFLCRIYKGRNNSKSKRKNSRTLDSYRFYKDRVGVRSFLWSSNLTSLFRTLSPYLCQNSLLLISIAHSLLLQSHGFHWSEYGSRLRGVRVSLGCLVRPLFVVNTGPVLDPV